MISSQTLCRGLATFLIVAFALPAAAQSFRVQCPAGTKLHPANTGGNPAYSTFTQWGRTDGKLNPTPAMANPGIKCQQISGGDGFATMGDGTQTYLFGFGPLSGMVDQVAGLPGTQPASVFLQDSSLSGNLAQLTPIGLGGPGVPNPLTTYNGAVGLVPDPDAGGALTGHVDPRLIMDVGIMNANHTAPLMVIDEGDEFFLTLTNVGQIMRPDLFEEHTVHFHGYPNASAFYDGVPDASVAISVGGSFTYYYLAPEAGTYFWHCHISPPEHLQMGMVGQIYVRPKQNKVNPSTDLGAALLAANKTSANPITPPAVWATCNDILCTDQTPLPAGANPVTGVTGVVQTAGAKYAYNDGDGSTRYDVEYPLQMMGFDPNFHFISMTFNPPAFAEMKDKYFMLNGRGYPDTINPDALSTKSADGVERYSQPMRALINIPEGGKALLRISSLNVTEYQTLASVGIPMRVIGINARLLRAEDGTDMAYDTNSITLGGGESLDVILDASKPEYAGCTESTPCTFYLYSPNLDHLSNDAENFGGLMTEIRVGSSS